MIKVTRKADGKTWCLFPRDGGYWLTPNDGRVPSGQFIGEETARELFTFPEAQDFTLPRF